MDQAADESPHKRGRNRLVFLGSDLNPLSVRCLLALLEDDAYDILVGLDSGRGGIFDVLRMIWTRHGSLGLLRRIRAKLRTTVRVKLRKMGWSLGPPASLSEITVAYRLASISCEDVNSAGVVERIAEFDPQLIVVANFSQILRPALLDLPPRGVINLHPSLLPKYRGPMPYYWVLQNREPTSGTTVHYVDREVDAGDIIAQVEHIVHSDDTEESLRRRCVRFAAPLLARATREVLRGTAQRTPQDAEAASYYGFPPRGASQL